jgi:hypothetical protein
MLRISFALPSRCPHESHRNLTGNKIHFSVQLIRADTDEHLWSATSDRELQDVLVLRTVAPEVYEACLKGRFALHKNNRAELDETLRHFQAAVNTDTTFALRRSQAWRLRTSHSDSSSAVCLPASLAQRATGLARGVDKILET